MVTCILFLTAIQTAPRAARPHRSLSVLDRKVSRQLQPLLISALLVGLRYLPSQSGRGLSSVLLCSAQRQERDICIPRQFFAWDDSSPGCHRARAIGFPRSCSLA